VTCKRWADGDNPLIDFRNYRGNTPPRFAHETERELATMLDEAGLPWLYEPRTFVLEADDERVLEAFTPDFYLPDADVYVELTAMKQSETYRKNRKVRKLQALGEVVTILYRRDLERLRERYGRRAA
jgi:hypoxanthine phosphoribosyltransferase